MPPIVVVCVCVVTLSLHICTHMPVTCPMHAPCHCPQACVPCTCLSPFGERAKRRLRHLSNCSILILHFCLVGCFKRIWFSLCTCFCPFAPSSSPYLIKRAKCSTFRQCLWRLIDFRASVLCCLSFVAPCVSWVAHIACWQAGKFTNQFLYVRTLLTFPGPIAITGGGEGGAGGEGYASCSYPSRPSRLLHYPVTFVVRVAN